MERERQFYRDNLFCQLEEASTKRMESIGTSRLGSDGWDVLCLLLRKYCKSQRYFFFILVATRFLICLLCDMYVCMQDIMVVDIGWITGRNTMH